MSDFTGHTPGPWRGLRDAYGELHVIGGEPNIQALGVIKSDGGIIEPDANLIIDAPDLLAERDRLREALNHAMKGDMDPEDRVIVAQILAGRAQKEAGDDTQ